MNADDGSATVPAPVCECKETTSSNLCRSPPLASSRRSLIDFRRAWRGLLECTTLPRRHPFQYAQFSLADDAFCPSPTSHSAKRHPADGHAQLGNCRTHLFEVRHLRHLDTLYIWNPALIDLESGFNRIFDYFAGTRQAWRHSVLARIRSKS